MKNLLTPVRIAVATLLSGCVAVGWAQSLGTPVAEVWMGRPLDITVPARLASDLGDECVHADVFFGEQRVRRDQVRTTLSGADAQRRVRVETSVLIDEPVVTVALRAGCRNTVTRSYTLLPAVAPESVIAGLVRQQQLAAAGTAAPADARVPAAAVPPRVAPAHRSGVRTAVARAEEVAPPRLRTAKAFQRTAAAAPGPRLRLEPLDLELEPQAALLRVSNRLAEPEGDAARRATAALLWQAINAGPEEVMRTTAMLQALESDLVQLRRSSQQTRSEVAALRARLDQEQPWYARPLLAELLGALVLLAGGAAAWSWQRSRRAIRMAPWYASNEAGPQESTVDVELGQPASVLGSEQDQVTSPAGLSPQGPMPSRPAPAGSSQAGRGAAQPAPARTAGSGALRVETLAATLEEVDFLASLGLLSDAMLVLRSYLQDSSSPAPVAFFELMRLCEAQDDVAALMLARRRYAEAFGVEPPPLAHAAADGGLDQLPELAARVTRAWGRPEALDVIEHALFDLPRPGAALTVQAGRDLVCLYDVAMRLALPAADPAGPLAPAGAHPLAPWALADGPAAAQAAAQAAAEADGGLRFALDVDLGASAQPVREQNDEPDLAPLLAEMQAAAARDAAAREAARRAQEEDAFNAAVALERVTVSRF